MLTRVISLEEQRNVEEGRARRQEVFNLFNKYPNEKINKWFGNEAADSQVREWRGVYWLFLGCLLGRREKRVCIG